MTYILEIIFRDVLINITVSLVSSMVGLILLYILFAPRLEISDYILKNTYSYNDTRYTFKIVNKSQFSLIDLRVSLFSIRLREHSESGKYNILYTSIPMIDNEIKMLKPYRRIKFGKTGAYAFLITTDFDLSQILEQKTCSLEFSIDATHPVSLSGASRKVFCKVYSDLNCIKSNAQFRHGKNLNTI
jgi:hypothetical protein